MKIRAYLDNESHNFRNELSTFEKIKYIFHFIAQAFLYAVFVFFCCFGLSLAIYFGDMVYNFSKGNNKNPLFDAYIIVSQSMIPTINVDDAIVVRRETGENLDLGDIITFSSIDPSYPDLTVTHRIVSKEMSSSGKYLFRTKGDNNTVMDPSIVSEDRIYGKVILRIPKLGVIRRFLTTSYGFAFGIVIPSLAIVIFDIIKLFSRSHKNKENEDLEII